MSSTVDHPLVLQWLSRIPGSNSESLPTSDRSNHGPYGQIYSKSLPTYSQIIPSHKFHTTRARSVHNSDSDTTLSSTKFNSMHRSTYELLKSLPSPLHTLRILPYLPTYQANLDTLITMIPNRADNPIHQSVFESLTTAETEYRRVLDLRERLRVEEIILEMHIDMDQLYLDPPSFHASQTRLGDIRMLIARACFGLSYIQEECSANGLELDVAHVSQHYVTDRPLNHPYRMFSCYLKPDAQAEFDNYIGFIDPTHITKGTGLQAWQTLSVVGEVAETSDADSESLAYSFGSDPLTHDHYNDPSHHDSLPVIRDGHSLRENSSALNVIKIAEPMDKSSNYPLVPSDFSDPDLGAKG